MQVNLYIHDAFFTYIHALPYAELLTTFDFVSKSLKLLSKCKKSVTIIGFPLPALVLTPRRAYFYCP